MHPIQIAKLHQERDDEALLRSTREPHLNVNELANPCDMSNTTFSWCGLAECMLHHSSLAIPEAAEVGSQRLRGAKVLFS